MASAAAATAERMFAPIFDDRKGNKNVKHQMKENPLKVAEAERNMERQTTNDLIKRKL